MMPSSAPAARQPQKITMKLASRRDLIGGNSCWREDGSRRLRPDPLPAVPVDVAIVGAGVMGAMMAESLTRIGKSVALVDRRHPSHGSTAASTALVMWAADVPLLHLGREIGEAEAGRRWRRVHRALRNLEDRVGTLGIDCGWTARPVVYLAGDLLDMDELRDEADARQRAGLHSEYLAPDAVAGRFGIPPRAGLVSGGSFEVDPVELTLGLLELAQRRGASLSFPVDIQAVHPEARGVRLVGADGEQLLAGTVILAAGYEAAGGTLPKAFTLGSSFAIATHPGVAPLWRENAMMWEASDPYLYMRTTRDGRIIVGGEDEETADPEERDTMIEAKRATIERKAAAMLGIDRLEADCAWAATFGGSPDGLPAIGLMRGCDNIWLASGFGGNGITFAALAAELVVAGLSGVPDADAAGFDPYRFG